MLHNTPMPSRPEDDKTEIRLDVESARFPWIEVIAGPKGKGRFFLRSGKNFIGRSRENDIILEDSSVSRRHAVIDITEGGASISDLGSRNGTKLDGRKIEQPLPLTHEARIQMGLYELKFLAQAANPEEASLVNQADRGAGELQDQPSESSAEEAEPPALSPSLSEDAPPPAASPPQEMESAALSQEKTQKGIKVRRVLYVVLLLALAVAVVLGGHRALKHFLTKEDRPRTVVDGNDKPPEMGEALTADRVQIPETQPGVQAVFLDFSSSPIPAQIFFGDKLMGVTPFRISTTLGKGKWYEAKAVFQLPDIGDSLEERTQFHSPEDASVIPVSFAGTIGLFKILSLPRDAQLYLEGYFERDPYRAKPIKFAEIIYGKPVYVPYGRYILELRRSRQLGESQTFLDEVIYRREFYINGQQTNYTVDVNEEALKMFPVQVTSVPPGAKLFIDEKEVGTTPYSGNFPVGEHLLTMKKEGYFDFVQAIRMEINMPYVAEIPLKTSEAGEYINKADALMKEERFAEALPVLVEAFSKKPTPRETAQISYLVGVSYLRQKAAKEAQDYFMKAMEHPDFKYPGRLGIASLTYEQGDAAKALQLLVEVLVSSEDTKVRADAGVLFQKLSPLKSVLYIASEPPAARVFINGNEASQITPLIVHDLGVGSYRIQMKKDGYEDQEMKLNLGVSEFRPVVMKLRRIAGYVSP